MSKPNKMLVLGVIVGFAAASVYYKGSTRKP